MGNDRKDKLKELVDEVTKDFQDIEKIKSLTNDLHIEYSDDPIQLLNNVLRGIHSEGPKNESNY